MKKRLPLLFVCAVALGLTSAIWTSPVPSQRTKQPNIIFILADDLGYGDLGCYGQRHIKTPNLDRMAAEGMRFTDFYTGSTVCAPSRAVLMTGQHTGHTYIRGNGEIPLREQDEILPQWLKKAGYTTALFGKWGLGNVRQSGSPEKKGWDTFYGLTHHVAAHYQQPDTLWQIQQKTLVPVANTKKEYANELFTQQALGYLEKAGERPFFMYLALTIPHAELRLPRPQLTPYLTADGSSIFAPEKPWADGQHYGGQPTPKAAYAGLVTAVDQYVGLLMQKLEERGLAENTVVFFASDNGTHAEGGRTLADVAFFNSSGPLRGIKRDLYDGGIRTPFLARWKGKIPAGKVSSHIGAFWDIAPTALELAGSKPTAPTDGISFVPTLLAKKNQKQHPYLYWEFYERGFDQAIRKEQWKAIRTSRNQNKMELYDVRKEPAEQTDLADQYPEVAREMVRLMDTTPTKSPIFPLKR